MQRTAINRSRIWCGLIRNRHRTGSFELKIYSSRRGRNKIEFLFLGQATRLPYKFTANEIGRGAPAESGKRRACPTIQGKRNPTRGSAFLQEMTRAAIA